MTLFCDSGWKSPIFLLLVDPGWPEFFSYQFDLPCQGRWSTWRVIATTSNRGVSTVRWTFGVSLPVGCTPRSDLREDTNLLIDTEWLGLGQHFIMVHRKEETLRKGTETGRHEGGDFVLAFRLRTPSSLLDWVTPSVMYINLRPWTWKPHLKTVNSVPELTRTSVPEFLVLKVNILGLSTLLFLENNIKFFVVLGRSSQGLVSRVVWCRVPLLLSGGPTLDV